METFPSFSQAAVRFKEFLTESGQLGNVIWVFRDDVFYANRDALFVSVPLPNSNNDLAARAYDAGVRQKQLEMKAIAKSPNGVMSTIWYPISDQHRPQGWECGLRFTVVDPLQDVREVRRGWRWHVRQFTRNFKRYHGYPAIDQVLLSAREIR